MKIKQCRQCGKKLKTKDGRRKYCSNKCFKLHCRTWWREWWLSGGKESRKLDLQAARDYYHQFKLEHPIKHKARQLTSKMIRNGDIKRSEVCQWCGEHDLYFPVAHHLDYRNPLKIIFLCYQCHRRTHAGEIKKKDLLAKITPYPYNMQDKDQIAR
jgi:hypothetical protein